MFGSGDHSQRTLVVRQEPEVVAWALAQICREMMPGADPDPAHAHPQTLRIADGSYQLHISHPEGGPIRIAANGRIGPARLALAGDVVTYVPGEFSPSPQTVSCENSLSSLRVKVHAHREGSQVEIAWWGPARAWQAVDNRIADGLLLLDACATSMELAAAGDWLRLRESLGQVSSKLQAGPASQSCKLAAPLHWYRSLAHQHLGSVIAARADLTHCLDLNPSLVSIRARLLHMDDRLCKSSDELRNIHTMVNDGSLGLVGHLLANRFKQLRAENDAVENPGRAAKVIRALDRGDIHSARSWLDRCIAEDSGVDSEELWNLQVQLLRASGEFRSAFSAGLAMRVKVGGDPNTLLDTCLDSLQLGDPSLGLRLLARNWTELHRQEPRNTEQTLERVLTAMDPRFASRILAMERVPELADPTFLALLEDSGLDPRSPLLLGHLGKQQRRSWLPLQSRIEIGTQPGFENAPGVAPVR